MGTAKTPEQTPAPGYEVRDANFRRVMIVGVGLLGVMIAGLLFSWAVYSLFLDHTADPGAPTQTFTVPSPEKLPPLPRLQADPRVVYQAMARMEDSVLTTYGWIDKDAGLVRVPVEKAMEMLVRKGVKERTP